METVLLLYFLDRGDTVTTGRYCGTLQRLRRKIRRQRFQSLRQGLLILHDNARLNFQPVLSLVTAGRIGTTVSIEFRILTQ
jgi:hypothetical protein